ncbi:MAG TPA: hypothetical protein VM737_06590 [Gemmatimonadota bacterium]|nr:hypothetical protein [Gemmatimonadota bacterium]
MRLVKSAFIAVLFVLPGAAAGQHQVTAGLGISDPRGQLDENTDTGFGFVGSYLYALNPTRTVAVGASGAFQAYGGTARQAALSSTIPDIRVDVDTSNNTAFLQGVLQIKAPTGVIQPYAQGTAGYGFFFTTTSLRNPFDGETVLSDTNQNDGAWIWGAGGGLLVKVYQGEPEPTLSAYQRAGVAPREPVKVYVDAGARWLQGGEVEYLKEGSLVTDEGEFDIDSRLARSDIELIQYQLAVTVEF